MQNDGIIPAKSLGLQVLIDLRNRATHFALFTTVSELNIRFCATYEQLVLP